ncbi:MAG TPA: iron transporter [Alphaproteobacteria bacterium]|nr:iron transporter [Alphaproteobacteria bacterium]
MRNLSIPALLALAAFLAAPAAHAAAEHSIGKAIEKDHMLIAPNYLTGITLSRLPKGASTAPGAIHLEVDVHAAKSEPHGFPAGAWMPYLTVDYTIRKIGGDFKASGRLYPMTAGDGPHYANNVALAGPGDYRLTYSFKPPSSNGFIRHTDKASGVPGWWKPFSLDWSFRYPAKP